MSKLMAMFDYFFDLFQKEPVVFGVPVAAETGEQALSSPGLLNIGECCEGVGFCASKIDTSEGGSIWRVTYEFSPWMPRPNDGITEAIAVYGKRPQECLE